MSNIAVPKPTETQGGRELVSALRTLLGTAILIALLVTLTPFESTSASTPGSGNLVNQLGYSALALLAILGHLMFSDRRVVLSLLRPTWAIMAAWLAFSAFHALDPSNATRALAFSLAAMIAATGALCLPPTIASFRIALTVAAFAVLGLSYLGVIALPGAAIHSDVGPEGHQAGLWRGIYSHKNVAGAVMAALFFVGVYLVRCRHLVSGAAITLLSLVFVLQTGSKTAAALLPLVVLLIVSSRFIGGRLVTVLILFTALAGVALATLGSVLVPAIDDLVQRVLPGTTFTGRTDLWIFAIELLRDRIWTGFGLESFWRSGFVLGTEASRELAWDPRGSTNAHNGYLDMAMATGLPGLALSLLVLIVLPLADFVRAGTDRESARLADLFLMILVFGLMNAFLESFFFQRASANWMTLWIAVVGLRLLSRHRLSGA